MKPNLNSEIPAASGLEAALERLYARRSFGIKLGLDVTQALMHALGNPEAGLRCLHIAGTNGKGSVCAMLDSLLTACGTRTGRTTSPHLCRFNERFMTGGVSISDAELAERVGAVEQAAETVEAQTGLDPTFFECATAIAFSWFERRGVDWAIVETGLGGRLDATNVITPVLSVITSIGLDHTRQLGPDLASITREKCGIIKPGRPVICGRLPEEAAEVVHRQAAALGAPVIEAAKQVSVSVLNRSPGGQTVHVETASGLSGRARFPLQGDHQVDNLALAVCAVDLLAAGGAVELDEATLKAGIAGAVWPGRFQLLKQDPPTVLDGSHNPPAASALVRTLGQVFPRKPVSLVFGANREKDLDGILAALAACTREMWVVPVSGIQNADADTVRAAADRAGIHARICESLEAGWTAAERCAQADGGVVCITGSLYLAGDVLSMAEKGLPAKQAGS